MKPSYERRASNNNYSAFHYNYSNYTNAIINKRPYLSRVLFLLRFKTIGIGTGQARN